MVVGWAGFFVGCRQRDFDSKSKHDFSGNKTEKYGNNLTWWRPRPRWFQSNVQLSDLDRAWNEFMSSRKISNFDLIVANVESVNMRWDEMNFVDFLPKMLS